MRNLFFISIIVFVSSCTPQKHVSGGGAASGAEIQKQGNKMFGKIIIKSTRIGNEQKEVPVLYFDRNGVEYFINIPGGKVSKEEIKKYTYKDIDILGEIKTGKYTVGKAMTRSGQETVPDEEGPHLVIYKILN